MKLLIIDILIALFCFLITSILFNIIPQSKLLEGVSNIFAAFTALYTIKPFFTNYNIKRNERISN